MRGRPAYPSGYYGMRVLRLAGTPMSTLAGVYLYGIACFVTGLVIGMLWESHR